MGELILTVPSDVIMMASDAWKSPLGMWYIAYCLCVLPIGRTLALCGFSVMYVRILWNLRIKDTSGQYVVLLILYGQYKSSCFSHM
jgi:hypothetical protein